MCRYALFYFLNQLLLQSFCPLNKTWFYILVLIQKSAPILQWSASRSYLVVQFLQKSVKQNILHSSLLCEFDTELQASHQKWTHADEIFYFSKENINILLWWSCSAHLVNQSSIIESVCLNDTESNAHTPHPPPPRPSLMSTVCVGGWRLLIRPIHHMNSIPEP